MINLEKAIEGMGDAQNKLRDATAINSPTVISEQMMRLSQYAGILDSFLAEIEKEYEIKLSAKILEYTKDGEMKFSPAETRSKMELAETKGQILYLTRLVGSAWKQVGVSQSRWNHLNTESRTNL